MCLISTPTKRTLALAYAVFVCLAVGSPGVSWASNPLVKLTTGFIPNRLGASTTMTVDFLISTRDGSLPPPLTRVRLGLPPGVGLATTTLGLAACEPTLLEEQGIKACPSNSLMGRGTALVTVPIGTEALNEHVKVTIAMAPSSLEHTTMEMYAAGKSPVVAQVVFPAALIEEPPPIGAYLETNVPVVPTVPGGPDAVVVSFSSTFGPQGLVYHRRFHGRTINYQPLGLTVPTRCPRAGFRFTIAMSFLDGSQAFASHRIPCPPR